MASFGVTSMASAQTQTISNTGQNSHNSINSTYTNNCKVINTTHVSANSNNYQKATTGDATESGNTVSGSWGGWASMDPSAAQNNGTSYSSWWNNVVNWIGQRSAGGGWNSDNSNLGWAPGGSSWMSYDPMTWQTNGQSFGNWYNGVESYLNSNTPNWLLTWPSTATGNGSWGGGAVSGNATNNYNANFTININNAARAAAGTNSCGQSNFVPPVTGGMGGGGNGGNGGSSSSVSASPANASAGSGGARLAARALEGTVPPFHNRCGVCRGARHPAVRALGSVSDLLVLSGPVSRGSPLRQRQRGSGERVLQRRDD